MNKKVCCFCGHRYIYHVNAEKIIREQLIKLIENDNIYKFYSGNMGEFDHLCESIVRNLKNIYPNIKLYWIAPYNMQKINENRKYYIDQYDGIIIPNLGDVYYKRKIGLRNRWMVDKSDAILCYVIHNYGGSYNMMSYAEQKKGILIEILNEDFRIIKNIK